MRVRFVAVDFDSGLFFILDSPFDYCYIRSYFTTDRGRTVTDKPPDSF